MVSLKTNNKQKKNQMTKQDKSPANKKRPVVESSEDEEEDELENDDDSNDGIQSKKLRLDDDDVESTGSEDESVDEEDSEDDSNDEEEENESENELTNKTEQVKSSSVIKNKNVKDGLSILITNLDNAAQPDQLRKALQDQSQIKIEELNIRKRPYALINVNSAADANKMIDKCNSLRYKGKALQLTMCPANLHNVLNGPNYGNPTTSMFVTVPYGNLDINCMKKQIPSALSISKKNKGFHISFKTIDDSKAVMSSIGSQGDIDGKKVFLKYIKDTESEHSGVETRLIIANIDFNIDEKQVKELVPKANYFVRYPNTPGSFYCEFHNANQCKEAGTRLHNFVLAGRPVFVNYVKQDDYFLKVLCSSKIDGGDAIWKKMFPKATSVALFFSRQNPKYVLIKFSERSHWEQAIKYFADNDRVNGVKVFFRNRSIIKKQTIQTKSVNQKKDDKSKKSEIQSKPVEQSKKNESKKVPLVQPGSTDEEDSDENEEMDAESASDEDECNQSGSDEEEENEDTDDDEDEDDDDDEKSKASDEDENDEQDIKEVKVQKVFNNNNKQNFNNKFNGKRGGQRGGGNMQRGGFKARGGFNGRGGFKPRGRGGNFQQRGNKRR